MSRAPALIDGLRKKQAYDRYLADRADLEITHRIELSFAKSPEKGIIAAGIFTHERASRTEVIPGHEDESADQYFRINGDATTYIKDPDRILQENILRAWLDAVLAHTGHVEARLLCPGLQIRRWWKRDEIPKLLADPSEARSLIRSIYTLMDKGYEWDARERAIVRLRGRQFAETPINLRSKPS